MEPDKNTAHHYGGRMAFLPDGTLLITSGEGFTFRDQAQDIDSQFGKTLRIHSDGSVPVDNPYRAKGGAAAKVWTFFYGSFINLEVLAKVELAPGKVEVATSTVRAAATKSIDWLPARTTAGRRLPTESTTAAPASLRIPSMKGWSSP